MYSAGSVRGMLVAMRSESGFGVKKGRIADVMIVKVLSCKRVDIDIERLQSSG